MLGKEDFGGILKSSWKSSRRGDDGCSRHTKDAVQMALSAEGRLYNKVSPLVLSLSAVKGRL